MLIHNNIKMIVTIYRNNHFFFLSYEDIKSAEEYAVCHNKKVAENSLSLVVNKKNIIPVCKDSIKKVTFVVLSYDESHIESLKVMKEEFEKRGVQVSIKRNIADYDEIKETDDNSDLIIYIARCKV